MTITHVYKASFRDEGGGNNRTFAFWGRILVPALFFFGFFGGFLRVFLMYSSIKSFRELKSAIKINFSFI